MVHCLVDGVIVDTPISAQAARRKVTDALLEKSTNIKAVMTYVWEQIDVAISREAYWCKFHVGDGWHIRDGLTASLVKSTLEEYGYKITEQDSVHGLAGLTVSWSHVERQL